MRKSILFLFLLGSLVVKAQLNMSLLSQLTYPQNSIDIWGYVDENNNEYAMVGLQSGVSIVNVTNPNSVNEVFYTSGYPSGWRDLKVWNDKAYITNEGDEGVMIIDLSPLPQDSNLTVTNYTGNVTPFTSAHNLFIDENGFAYLFGAKNNGVEIGTIILDLNYSASDPNFETGVFDDFYLHDGMVRGDTLWGAAINDGFFAAVDVADKQNQVVMATQYTPNYYAHNIWVSDDGHKVFTTDEVSGAYIASYDVSNLNNITELDRIQSNPGSGVIPHNAHFIDNYVVTSYYKDGVTVHDVSNPSNMVEVGNYEVRYTNILYKVIETSFTLFRRINSKKIESYALERNDNYGTKN